jgi:hypothetical protein
VGNGCRTLTDASGHDLALAMIPVRLLVIVWVLGTGVLAFGGAREARGYHGADALQSRAAASPSSPARSQPPGS